MILAIILLIAVLIYILPGWFKEHSQKTMNKDCLVGSTKSFGGVFFGGCLDKWHISHFVLWFIIAKLAPKQHLLVWIISILWEVIEHFALKKLGRCKTAVCGRVEDIFLNILGYTLGSMKLV